MQFQQSNGVSVLQQWTDNTQIVTKSMLGHWLHTNTQSHNFTNSNSSQRIILSTGHEIESNATPQWPYHLKLAKFPHLRGTTLTPRVHSMQFDRRPIFVIDDWLINSHVTCTVEPPTTDFDKRYI